MPVLMAAWLPLMRAAFSVPASQPTSAPPGNTSLGRLMQAAVVDGACAVADALAAFDVRADRRVRLPALHLLERAHPGVLVVQPE
jgi:hypothetical protein